MFRSDHSKADAAPPHVFIIGAGIVGLCIAHEVLKQGFQVTVFEPNEPGSQCSSGNAGAISSGSIVPLAMPGIMKSTVSMLLDPTGPLHVPFRYWASAAPWLYRFVRSAQAAQVASAADSLHDLLKGSVRAHLDLAMEIGSPELVRQEGHLHLYPNAAYRQKDDTSWNIKRDHGLRMQYIDWNAIHELEPAIASHYSSAIYLPDEGRVTDPQAYTTALATSLKARGVRFERTRITRLSRSGASWVIGDQERTWAGDKVVVSAGAWSAKVLSSLNIVVPLISQRGYHIQVAKPGIALNRIVVLADRKVFMNPLHGGLRVAGTVEIDSIDREVNMRRALLLKDHARAALPNVNLDDESIWLGHRPCMPDSMPVIGPVRGQENLFCAFGHGHLGLTGSANTAKWVADAMLDNAPDVQRASLKRMMPFSIERFKAQRPHADHLVSKAHAN